MNLKTEVHAGATKICIPTVPSDQNAISIYTCTIAHAVPSGVIAFPSCVCRENCCLTTELHLHIIFLLEVSVEFSHSLCSLSILYVDLLHPDCVAMHCCSLFAQPEYELFRGRGYSVWILFIAHHSAYIVPARSTWTDFENA